MNNNMNNIMNNKLSKALTNNYTLLLLVLVSYIYLIIKINNNSFKELLTYIISVLLFYIYFKNLKKSYTFGFFVLLIRYVFKQIFNNIENFKESKEKNKEIEKRNKEKEKKKKEIEKNKQDMDKQATTTEDDLTTEPIAKIDTGLTDEEIEEMQKDDTKTDSYVKSTENGVIDSVDKADLGITI